jgi:uncharacterized membrane protein YjjP (DUF1212 family)
MNASSKSARHRVLTRHIARLENEINQLQEVDQRYFWVRLAVLIAGALGMFIGYQSRQSNALLIAFLVFLMVFFLAVFLNRRVKYSLQRFRLSREYFRIKWRVWN